MNQGYDIFLEMFHSLYNKHCSIQNYNKKNKLIKCPRLTKGLQNACNKKNSLYTQFIKVKTVEVERK